MADEPQQDRTEQPTSKRLEDARKKGDVPRSKELTMTGVMLSGAASLLLLAEPMGGQMSRVFQGAFDLERALVFDSEQLPAAFAELSTAMLAAFLPLAAVLVGIVFLCALSIGGWTFSLEAVTPKFERISPIKGIKRIFSANSLNELVKALAKFLLVGVVAVGWLWWSIDELLGLGREPIAAAIPHALEICAISLLVVSSGLVLIAAADVPFQLWQYQKKLRMTKQQVKEEMKDTEGRPEVKSRIRQLQQQVATRRMMEELPTADVVITNPTHFAVALKYDESTMGAPRVIAKGKDLLAARIREVAMEHDVPLFSAPPLARVLYRTADIGDAIPARRYTAVAQVLAYIFQLDRARAPGNPAPEAPVPQVDESEFE